MVATQELRHRSKAVKKTLTLFVGFLFCGSLSAIAVNFTGLLFTVPESNYKNPSYTRNSQSSGHHPLPLRYC